MGWNIIDILTCFKKISALKITKRLNLKRTRKLNLKKKTKSIRKKKFIRL